MIKVPEKHQRSEHTIVVKLGNNIIRIVFTELEQNTLRNPEEFKLYVNAALDILLAIEGVDVDEAAGGQPKESEGVELKVGDEGESEHV